MPSFIMSLYRLPIEIFEPVIAHLKEEHPPSLLSLALANKSCFTRCAPAIKSLMFHDVRMNMRRHGRKKPDLATDVEKLVQKIEKAGSSEYVRRLVIDEHSCPSCAENDEWQPPRLEDLKSKPGRPYGPLYGNLNHPHGYSDLPAWSNSEVRGREQDWLGVHYDNDTWLPLVSLIEKLPKLEDLVYLCKEQFPPCLLDALHEKNPQCRLRLHSLLLRSLNAIQTDPYEFKLVTSPSLYSVVLKTEELGGISYRGDPCYQRTALLRSLRLAPNLKEVFVGRDTPTARSNSNLPSPIFTKFTQEEEGAGQSLGSLEHLKIYDCALIPKSTLNEWGEFTNFSALRSLELTGPVTCEALACWTSACTFPNLQKLSMWLKAPLYSIELYEHARSFLRSLPPLTELCLEGWHSFLPIESIVSHHGPSLRKLALLYNKRHEKRCLTESDIKEIATYCPILEDLSCKIQRTQGDPTEVRLYRALGTIRALRNLSLDLSVADPALYGGETADQLTMCPPERNSMLLHELFNNWEMQLPTLPRPQPVSSRHPCFDKFGNELAEPDLRHFFRSRNGHVRRFMINSAVDKDLACSIFRTVAAAKPPDTLPLEGMNLRIDELEATRIFTAAWRVERDVRHDRLNELVAWEPGLTSGMLEQRARPLPTWQGVIFRTIWPRPKNGEVWVDIPFTPARPKKEGLVAKLVKQKKPAIMMPTVGYDWWDQWFGFPLAV
ncbi:hypothetical protein N7462_007236 [Penicillium macrosclerotiorum]|uniref:uncharacterized protein n=1 Tax=Penicillium macrosclerotiorum TaxID=303699 RepID=UPI0025466D34|nr:uncharacterized protein N7462_007236 [Penicillium macrosclerotiorum]KAJ5678992.1 hypothetical protein N7462_007236 [Penicillium macrosclerotiorum]